MMVSHAQKRWKSSAMFLATLTASAVAFGAGPAQAATDAGVLSPEEVYSALASASKVEGIPGPLLELDKDGLLPLASSGTPLTVTTPMSKLSFSIGGEDVRGVSIGDGLYAYANLPGVATVPIGRDDGSIQVVTVIDGPASPQQFRYALGSAEGLSLREIDKGFISAFDKVGNPVASIAPAWAVDANGARVPTWYELQGGELLQHVEHSEAYAYPIVADPWVGGTYLEEFSWYTGNQRVMYRPTWHASWGCFGNIPCGTVWMGSAQNELVNAQSSTTLKNRAGNSSTKNQIGCHMIGAGTKSPWNLETDAPDLGLAGFMATACN